MSTLTSSPSPGNSFHVQRSTYASYPFASSASAPSPKQWSLHASPVQHASGSASGPKAPRAHYVESPAIERAPRYVHQGTQYSPDGSPPTSTHSITSSRGQEREAAARKRKERDPMSTSAASSASLVPSHPPSEPEPRRDPTPLHTQQNSTATSPSTSTHRPPPQHNDAEPREARSTHGHSSAPKRSRPSDAPAKLMPLLYQNSNPKDLGILISSMLMELIRLNDQIPLRDGRLTRFHSRAPPGISVSDYLQRLIHHATLSPPILLSMVWYIDLLCNEYTAFTINSLTVHRFLITAATVAAKGLSDSFWTNPTYARIGGIPVTELATLELEFLQKVHWRIVPRPETLVEYYRSLVERTEGFELEPEVGGQTSRSTSVDESEGSEKESKGEESVSGASGDVDGAEADGMNHEPT